MCGRFSIAVRIGYLAERFGISEPAGITLPRFNIAPAEEVPVIIGNMCAQCVMMHWGLMPSRTTPAPVLINIRAEGLAGKNQFRKLLSDGRCIIPATGFYEWAKTGSQKYPMYFRLKTREIFGMAGLYSAGPSPGGKTAGTFSIITTSPNSLVRPFHDRMPVILNRDDEKIWMDQEHGTAEDLVRILDTFPPGEMEAYRVTRKVNNPSFKTEKAVIEEIPETNDLGRWVS